MVYRDITKIAGSVLFLLALCIAVTPALAGGNVPGQNWTMATEHAGFETHSGHSTVVFDGKMWVIGGWGRDYSCPGDSCTPAIWSSENGVNWTRETDQAAFGSRYGHRSIVFDNKIWVIGGRNTTTWDPMNDVWYSSDGTNWNCATEHAPFAPRWDFGITTFNSEMWVIGGSEDGILHNDVWHSSDGMNWTKATAEAAFPPRMEITANDFESKIWVTGGFDWSQHFNDQWNSKDGVNWTKVADHAAYPERRYHRVEVADNKLWLIGGIGGEDPYNWHYLTDVWYSSNGTDWTEATAQAEFPGRYEYTTAVFDNKLWVIGGTSGDDVWYSGIQ
ncbi:MAG: hypothetical protein LUQ71_10625 [Methanoregula sp.]|nr:hypothetical protein [Methanoregula sp.]